MGSIHICFEIKGTGIPCQECLVAKRGSCQIMLNILNMSIYSDKVKNSLKGLPQNDIKDIISKIIQAIMEKMRGYSGNTDAQFAGWVRGIIRNKRADYFRKKYSAKKISESDPDKTKDSDDTNTTATEDTDDREERQSYFSSTAILHNLPDLKQQEDVDKIEECDINNFLKKLKEKVHKGEITGTDVYLIQILYDGFAKGLTQEAIAGEIGIQPNTFNQQLSRLRKKLHKKGISFEP